LIFTNLVDFDMVYGHRNNVEGYARALEEFDSRLPEILEALRDEDMLIITADHGCDPTTKSTDHSREYVPLLVYGRRLKKGVPLGIRQTFADGGATVAEYLGIEQLAHGRSFYQEMKEGERID
jgi:phosphopentomutase